EVKFEKAMTSVVVKKSGKKRQQSDSYWARSSREARKKQKLNVEKIKQRGIELTAENELLQKQIKCLQNEIDFFATRNKTITPKDFNINAILRKDSSQIRTKFQNWVDSFHD